MADLDTDIPLSMQNAKVADLVDENGDWKVGELQSWLPVEIMNRLHAIPLQRIEYGHHVCACPGAGMGDFYVAHAYNI